MNNEEFNDVLNEAYEHLWQGRYRMALSSAKKVYEQNQFNSQAVICLAWAYLENGNTSQAFELANFAVELCDNGIESRLYRGFILMRLGIFEGALTDLDWAISHDPNILI